MSSVVFVGRAYGDFVPGVVAGERVAAACLSTDRLAVAQPLVLHVIGHAVVIANGSGQRLPDFCLAADADFSFVIGLRLRLGIWIGLWVGLRIRCRGVGNRRCCLA